MEDDISLCNGCHCMTHNIKDGKAHFICGKCGYDKALSDTQLYNLEEDRIYRDMER